MKSQFWARLLWMSLSVLLFQTTILPTLAQGKPLDLPVALPPGPDNWLLGQPYGNTVGAFFNGDRWYRAGQRLHFGIDLSMPCGTPLVAVADALVMGVDDLTFGSAPHNLILRHEESGLTTLYGHLLERPPLVNGQRVTRGQVVGLSGDPDLTCDSRPHLHLEVRSLDYRTAYNPVDYINANWDALAMIGSFSSQTFERDFDNARRWLTLDDQPDVAFGGAALNLYNASWPPAVQPPENPPLAAATVPLPAGATWTQTRLGYEGCCFQPTWHPTNPDRLYTIDGSPGQRAGFYEWRVSESQFDILFSAPPPFFSPDFSHELRLEDNETIIRRTSDATEWRVDTQGAVGALNPTNSMLLWINRPDVEEGQEPPPNEIWLYDMTAQTASQLLSLQSGNAVWLDANRLLIASSRRQVTTLWVYDLTTREQVELGQWTRLRRLSIAPGGGRLMFYLTYAENPENNGVYTIETTPGAQAVQLPWFGTWRWRDANSVYYIPFDPATNLMSLAYYDVVSGEERMLITPEQQVLTIANGDWGVSADGRRIIYLNATDLTMWLLEQSS